LLRPGDAGRQPIDRSGRRRRGVDVVGAVVQTDHAAAAGEQQRGEPDDGDPASHHRDLLV
jgi:hypothetical protein